MQAVRVVNTPDSRTSSVFFRCRNEHFFLDRLSEIIYTMPMDRPAGGRIIDVVKVKEDYGTLQ